MLWRRCLILVSGKHEPNLCLPKEGILWLLCMPTVTHCGPTTLSTGTPETPVTDNLPYIHWWSHVYRSQILHHCPVVSNCSSTYCLLMDSEAYGYVPKVSDLHIEGDWKLSITWLQSMAKVIFIYLCNEWLYHYVSEIAWYELKMNNIIQTNR